MKKWIVAYDSFKESDSESSDKSLERSFKQPDLNNNEDDSNLFERELNDDFMKNFKSIQKKVY